MGFKSTNNDLQIQRQDVKKQDALLQFIIYGTLR